MDKHIEELKRSVNSIIQRTGENVVTQNLLEKIENLQSQLQSLPNKERNEFFKQMSESIRQTIALVDSRLDKYLHLERTYNYSIVSAIIFIILSIFALFGYKLYKSLMEKELKKQEKQKLKQSKKAKKAN